MTWYHANVYFDPRVRTYSSQMSPTTYQRARGSVLLSAAAAPAVGAERIQRRNAAIKRHDSSDYESRVGRGKGSIVWSRQVQTKGSQKFWKFEASREEPSETPTFQRIIEP